MVAPAKKPAAKKPGKPKPGVEKGDSVYFKLGEQHTHGRVASHGAHGCHIDHEGGRSKVYWEDILGHRSRSAKSAEVIDRGDDGFLVQDDKGRRRFVAGDPPEHPGRDDTPDDHRDLIQTIHSSTPMKKSLSMPDGRVVFFKSGPLANRPGLTKKQITDKTGHQTTRWVKTAQDQPANDNQRSPDPGDKRGAAHGYGTHDLQPGSRVKFAAGDHKGEGEVTAVGEHGVTAKDSTGREHQIHHHEITHYKPSQNQKAPEVKGQVLGKQEPIPAESFAAADYAKSHDQADVSPESVLSNFPPDTGSRIEAAQKRVSSIEQTIDKYKQGESWNAERQALHRKIFYEGVPGKDKDGNDITIPGILSPESVKNATPADGEQPKFILLGGRGGSGKSSFKGTVYDPNKCIVLDADHIKSMMPEYEGWNAAQVHEESGEIFDNAVRIARMMGLNVVLDKTMKTAKSAIADVQAFKDAGYRTEAHYMHLPRQEAAKRAVKRFLDGGEKGRYVPVEVVLSNTTNEAAFDQVKNMVDAWSFRDNNVPKDHPPILISQSGDKESPANDNSGDGKNAPDLHKSHEADRMILLFRRM